MFIDFHTHKPTAEGVITPRSFGIHPWDAELAGPPTGSEAPVELWTWASFSPNDCKSNNSSSAQPPTYSRFVAAEIIGECGLDKACGVDWEKQIELFRWQIKIAAELQKPMVIHCVRAMSEVIAMRREARSPFSVLRSPFHVSPWVIHGFIGGIQQAEQLFRAGIWVSFGAAILDPRREKVRHCLAEIKSPFLLETDESDCGIAAIYEEAAKLRNSSLEVLSNTIKQTYDTLINL